MISRNDSAISSPMGNVCMRIACFPECFNVVIVMVSFLVTFQGNLESYHLFTLVC